MTQCVAMMIQAKTSFITLSEIFSWTQKSSLPCCLIGCSATASQNKANLCASFLSHLVLWSHPTYCYICNKQMVHSESNLPANFATWTSMWMFSMRHSLHSVSLVCVGMSHLWNLSALSITKQCVACYGQVLRWRVCTLKSIIDFFFFCRGYYM